MVKQIDRVFKGFSRETFEFLSNLQLNNSKVWFEAHKQDYQEYLLRPLQDLVTDLSGSMLGIDHSFETSPRINKTISRIYRDIRFSSDKAPYKTCMWITFKRPALNWKDAPAYFLEICPDSYRYGMGFFCASTDTMASLRELIDQEPEEFLQEISFYAKQKVFSLEGNKYKRILDRTKPEELLDWYQRKNLYLVSNRKVDERLLSRDLVDDLTSNFGLLAPFYHFLRKIKYRV